MVGESTDLCSAGVIIYCRTSQFWLKVSITEWLDSTSNYQGELLGTIIALLIICAASGCGIAPAVQTTVLFYDSHGVVSHGNSPLMLLPEKQKQADLIRLSKYVAGSM